MGDDELREWFQQIKRMLVAVGTMVLLLFLLIATGCDDSHTKQRCMERCGARGALYESGPGWARCTCAEQEQEGRDG